MRFDRIIIEETLGKLISDNKALITNLLVYEFLNLVIFLLI